MSHDSDHRVERAIQFISARIEHSPRYGIVLGTGSSIVASNIKRQAEFSYSQLPDFPVSTALGHQGELIFGHLNENPVVAMNGRFHLYEGHSVDDAAIGIRLMHALGVKVLFITNAAGGLNPQFVSGDIMVIHSHIDLMFRSAWASSTTTVNQRPNRRCDLYDPQLAKSAFRCARANNFVLHNGVYASLLGPNYETRAEYRMLRRIGADVAGMSTVPEVNVAAQLNMRILALSIVTNVAKPDVLETTSGQEVIDAANVSAPRISILLSNLIQTDRSG